MGGKTWEGTFRTRHRLGNIVALLTYINLGLEVNGYIEHLYRDLKPLSNNPHPVAYTGRSQYWRQLQELIVLTHYLNC